MYYLSSYVFRKYHTEKMDVVGSHIICQYNNILKLYIYTSLNIYILILYGSAFLIFISFKI